MVNNQEVALYCLVFLSLVTINAALARSETKLPDPPEGVRIETDLSYLSPGRTEKLDLYLPADRPSGTKSPAVLIIHGGGWVGGRRNASREFNIGTNLALNGYVCASIDYMLEAQWPMNLHDCKNGVRFLRVNAEKYQIDPDHIGVIGGSAGGHLALMVAYTEGVSGLEPSEPYPGVSNEVQAVVNLYGITNLLTRAKTDDEGNPTEVLCGASIMSATRDEDRAAWEMASPVYHVSEDVPPTLILHGLIDTTVDRNQAKELDEKLAEAGAEHEMMLLEGVGHTFDLQHWRGKPMQYDLRPNVIGFFDRYLKQQTNKE